MSSSTKIEHERVLTHTVSRKESTTRARQESTTHSESDEPKSAAQLKAKWESRASGDNKVANRTKAFGGSTGIVFFYISLTHSFPNHPVPTP